VLSTGGADHAVFQWALEVDEAQDSAEAKPNDKIIRFMDSSIKNLMVLSLGLSNP
jgi:hypothetical protein